MACCTELVVCVACCLPIFLCHPCIQWPLAENELILDFHKINDRHFGGNHVLQVSTNCLVINHDLIPSYRFATPTVAVALPVESVDAPTFAKSNIVPSERYMNILVPNGAYSGSFIPVSAPDGTQVQVSICSHPMN